MEVVMLVVGGLAMAMVLGILFLKQGVRIEELQEELDNVKARYNDMAMKYKRLTDRDDRGRFRGGAPKE